MHVKAEINDNGVLRHELFNSLSEAEAFSKSNSGVTAIFNYMLPGKQDSYRIPKVGVIAITDQNDAEHFSENNKFYIQRSYLKLIEDCNANVVPITYNPLEGAVDIRDADEGDFDRIIVFAYRHYVTHGKISEQLEETYRFISKLKDFVVFIDDPETGFFMPNDMPGLGIEYDDLKLDKEATITVIHGNTNDKYVTQNCFNSSYNYRTLYAPISVSSINFFGYRNLENTSEYDHVYSGAPKWGGRKNHFEEFMLARDKEYSTLWVGTSKEKIERKIGSTAPDNLIFKQFADRDYLQSTYGSGITTTVADHDVHRSMVSWRLWEAYLSNCLIYFDKSVPPTSNMSLIFGNNDAVVSDSKDLASKIAYLKANSSFKEDRIASQNEILSLHSKNMLSMLKDKMTSVIWENL